MAEYLTQQQLEDLQALATDPRDKLLIRTQFETGCTVSELVHITKDDIKQDHIQIQDRVCYVSQELIELLTLYASHHTSNYVFVSRQQEKLTSKRVQQIIKSLLKKLPKSFQRPTPHVLRYSHIIHAARHNVPLNQIMQQTGLAEQRISQILQSMPKQQNAYRRLYQ